MPDDKPIEDEAQEKADRLLDLRDDAIRLIATVATLEEIAEHFACETCSYCATSIAKVVRQEMFRILWDYERALGKVPHLPPNASDGPTLTDPPTPGVEGS